MIFDAFIILHYRSCQSLISIFGLATKSKTDDLPVMHMAMMDQQASPSDPVPLLSLALTCMRSCDPCSPILPLIKQMFAYSVFSSHFRGTTTINASVNANRRYYPPPNASPMIDEQTCFMIRNNEWVSVTKVPPPSNKTDSNGRKKILYFIH